MQRCLAAYRSAKAELLWASPRELPTFSRADEIRCHIITVTNDVIAKLKLVGKNLDDYSRETGGDVLQGCHRLDKFNISVRSAAA